MVVEEYEVDNLTDNSQDEKVWKRQRGKQRGHQSTIVIFQTELHSTPLTVSLNSSAKHMCSNAELDLSTLEGGMGYDCYDDHHYHLTPIAS